MNKFHTDVMDFAETPVLASVETPEIVHPKCHTKAVA